MHLINMPRKQHDLSSWKVTDPNRILKEHLSSGKVACNYSVCQAGNYIGYGIGFFCDMCCTSDLDLAQSYIWTNGSDASLH